MANVPAFWHRDWFLALALVLITLVAYQPAWNGQPIWDDDAHITKPELRSLNGLNLIWFKPGATQQYYPMAHSIFWLEHKLWGDAVLPYHLANILLHSFSALLLFRILRQLKVPGAWLAAAIFALHPVHVESVAWISELKNTLSGAFFLASALLYLRFDQSRNLVTYIVALALFILGLMSKTVIATLPAATLVVLWWRRDKLSWKHDVLPLLPFFFVGTAAGVLTAWVEHKFIGAQGKPFDFSFIERCLIAGRAFWFYLFKLFWPSKLIFIYPRWNISQASLWQYLFPVGALFLVGTLWCLRGRSRAPLASTLLFGGLLFPALGFFNVYPFVFSFVADHFQYLASIGVITLVAAGITLSLDRLPPRFGALTRIVPVAILIVLSALTWQQSHLYADAVTLYQSTLNSNPDCWMAHNNLGNIVLQKGKVDEAAAHYAKVLELLPDDADTHNNLGNALVRKGFVAEGITHYRKALELRANDPETHNNLGSALVREGLADEAIPHFEKALELRSDRADRHNAEMHYNLGNALLRKRRLDDAITHYREAVAIVPDYAEAHSNLGIAFQLQGRASEAIAEYERTLGIAPQSLPTRNNLARLLATCPDLSLRNGARAVQVAQEAVQLSGGGDPMMFRTLAAAYAENNQFPEAVAAAEKALQLAAGADNDSWVDAVRREMVSYQAHQKPAH